VLKNKNDYETAASRRPLFHQKDSGQMSVFPDNQHHTVDSKQTKPQKIRPKPKTLESRSLQERFFCCCFRYFETLMIAFRPAAAYNL